MLFMANERVGFEVDVELGSFRTQLRKAQQEVFAMVDKFGQFSPQATEAAKRVAELRDQLGDTQSLIQAFNPDQKFAALSQALRSVAGGFTALQGAVGLFGKQTEEVQAQLLKVQSALALSEGLNSFLDDGIQGFKNLASVVKTSVVSAFTTLKGALAATGIGLVAVAVGSLIANWDKLVVLFRRTFPALGELSGRFNEIKVVLAGVGNAVFQFLVRPITAVVELVRGDFKAAVEELKKGFDIVNNFQTGQGEQRQRNAEAARAKELEAVIEGKKRELEVRKAAGEETIKLEQDIAARRLELAKLQGQEYEDLIAEQAVLEARRRKEIADKQKAIDEKAAGEAKARQEKQTAEQQAAAEAAAQAIRGYNDQLALIGKTAREQELEQLAQWYRDQRAIIVRGNGDLGKLNALYAAKQGKIQLAALDEQTKQILADLATREEAQRVAGETDLARRQDLAARTIEAIRGFGAAETGNFQERLATLEQLQQSLVTNTQFNESQRVEIERASADARTEIARQEVAAKEALTQNGIAILEAAGAIAGQQTALGKSLAVASTVIGTYAAAQKAYLSQLIPGDVTSPVRATIAAAAAVVTGLARVKAILSVRVPGGDRGGGGQGVPQPSGLGGLGRSVTNPSQELQAAQVNAQNQPVRVFVVESDITDTQGRATRVSRAAVLGG
jgi:hypothetical protein